MPRAKNPVPGSRNKSADTKSVVFNDVEYRRPPSYVYYKATGGHEGDELHRAIWSFHNGPIPEGCQGAYQYIHVIRPIAKCDECGKDYKKKGKKYCFCSRQCSTANRVKRQAAARL